MNLKKKNKLKTKVLRNQKKQTKPKQPINVKKTNEKQKQ